MTEKIGSTELFEKQKRMFGEVINKIARGDQDLDTIQMAEGMISINPHVWEVGKGVAGSLLRQFLDKMSSKKDQQLFLTAEAASIKERLGYSSSCQAEKLIIDQIMFCWAGMIHVESVVSGAMRREGLSLREGEYWQNTLVRYQNRYLRAIETLARVRKLSKGIAFQVNIATDGGQQVNVSEAKKGL